MPIKPRAFVDVYQKALDEGVAAAFVGAGLSVPAGFVDWKELLREIAEELDLSVDDETDLIALAQFHVNHARGRGRINQKLVDEFTKAAKGTENHERLAMLPLECVWTTNYDHLLEGAFAAAHKRVDKKVTHKHLALTKAKRDVVLYKMHGDVDDPDDAVLTKGDYERYEVKRSLFSEQLRGDLLSKTFMFLGLSFTDPNVNYVLARVRALMGENMRNHYWLARDANKNSAASSAEKKRQKHRIEDLKTYGIRTVLIDDYSEIPEILGELTRRVHRRNVFVSGSAAEYGAIGEGRAIPLLRKLGARIIQEGFNVVCGMGLGIGDAVAVGAIEAVYIQGDQHVDERTILRPFPQVDPTNGKLGEIWSRNRDFMLGRSRTAIFVFGNKRDENGAVQPASGVRKEYELARKLGVLPIPIGATGYMARELANEVRADATAIFGGQADAVDSHVNALGDEKASDEELLAAVAAILKIVAPK
jgi:hypothetical protein